MPLQPPQVSTASGALFKWLLCRLGPEATTWIIVCFFVLGLTACSTCIPLQKPRVAVVLCMPAVLAPFLFLITSLQRLPEFTEVIFSCTLLPAVLQLCTFAVRRYHMRRELARMVDKIEGKLPAQLADSDGPILLVRSQWLLKHSRSGRRRQELEEGAFWSPGNAVRLLRERKVVVLSYRWLEADNPDPVLAPESSARGYHEQKLVDFLTTHPEFEAVFWDVLSLCQKPKGGNRNEVEEVLFKRGLEVMGNFYASPRTMVVQSTGLPSLHAGLKPYSRSGWCQFEQAMGMLSAAVGGARLERGIVDLATGSPPTETISFGDGAEISDFRGTFKAKFCPGASCPHLDARLKGNHKCATTDCPEHVTFTTGKDDKKTVFKLLDNFYGDLRKADRRATPCIVSLADSVYDHITPWRSGLAILLGLVLFAILAVTTGEILLSALEVIVLYVVLFAVCLYPSRQYQAANHCYCLPCCSTQSRRGKVKIAASPAVHECHRVSEVPVGVLQTQTL